MRQISPRVQRIIEVDSYYKICARSDEDNCQGRITMEHAIIYAGRQVDEAWAILPICAFHHGVDQFQDAGGMNKDKHEWLALSRANAEDRLKYPKIDWIQKLKYLNGKFK